MTEVRERRIACPATLNQETGRDLHDALAKQDFEPGDVLVADLSATAHIDSLGGAWLVALSARAAEAQASFRCEGHTGRVAEFVDMIGPGFSVPRKQVKEDEGAFEEIGGQTLKWIAEIRESGTLIVDTIYWLMIAPFEGRGFRWGLWIDEMYEMGVRAVRINCLMNFLLGLIIAMLSAAQVERFGARHLRCRPDHDRVRAGTGLDHDGHCGLGAERRGDFGGVGHHARAGGDRRLARHGVERRRSFWWCRRCWPCSW